MIYYGSSLCHYPLYEASRMLRIHNATPVIEPEAMSFCVCIIEETPSCDCCCQEVQKIMAAILSGRQTYPSTWRWIDVAHLHITSHHITSHLFHISKMVKISKIPKSIRNCRPSLRKHFGASGGAEI